MTYSVQVVLLIDLSLDLALHTQAHNVGVSLASDCRRIRVDYCKSFLESSNALSCILLFFLDIVFEVARQRLDLLDLLGQVCAETTKLVDHIGFNVPGLVGLNDSLLVEIAEEAVRIVQATIAE